MTERHSERIPELKAIGVIHSPFKEIESVPIQPVYAGDTEGIVEVFPEYLAGLQDLEGFERVWLVYWLHRAPRSRLLVQPFREVRERGLFATRAPCRPNPIGLSAVRLLRIDGGRLHVAGIDVVDGTPLLDIKPYCPRFDAFPESHSGWLDSSPVDRTVADDRFSDL